MGSMGVLVRSIRTEAGKGTIPGHIFLVLVCRSQCRPQVSLEVLDRLYAGLGMEGTVTLHCTFAGSRTTIAVRGLSFPLLKFDVAGLLD